MISLRQNLWNYKLKDQFDLKCWLDQKYSAAVLWVYEGVCLKHPGLGNFD